MRGRALAASGATRATVGARATARAVATDAGARADATTRAVAAVAVTAAVWLTGCADPTAPADELFDLPLAVDHNQDYRVVVPTRPGATLRVPVRPSWMAWDPAERLLSGRPGWENRGFHVLTVERIAGRDTLRAELVVHVTTGPIDCRQPFGAPEESPYVLPFPVGVTSRVTQSYCRTGPGGHHDTYAYDFSLPMGDTILAARTGLVYRVQESYTDGNGVPGRENFVYVEHADSTVARYVHLLHRGALVRVGDTVEAGEPLGLNGLTGGTSRPHLHFEVFRNRHFNDSTVAFAKRFSLPIAFRNADGPLDERGGLVEGAEYTALPVGPGPRGAR